MAVADRLPEAILADTTAFSASRLPAGGSPATSWLLETPTGPLVVKIQHVGSGIVDGHEYWTLTEKVRQLRLIHSELPGLSPYVVRVERSWATPTWAAYAMPFVPGRPLAGHYRDPARLRPWFAQLIDLLGRHGWHRSVAEAAPDFFAARHASRVDRRRDVLATGLPATLLGEHPVVNAAAVAPARQSLAHGMAGRGARRLRPAGLAFPVHGDLNLGNVLVAGERLTILDPRGTTEPWDPVYDLAKALFSLTVFEAAMTGALRVRVVGEDVRVWVTPERTDTVCELFWEVLDSSELGARLDEDDQDWRVRLAVTHAVHCVAEASCRLSDTSPRRGPAADGVVLTGSAYRRYLATGLYAVGLLLLTDVAGLLEGRIEPSSHIGRVLAGLCRENTS